MFTILHTSPYIKNTNSHKRAYLIIKLIFYKIPVPVFTFSCARPELVEGCLRALERYPSTGSGRAQGKFL
jgi:hypothetical protein